MYIIHNSFCYEVIAHFSVFVYGCFKLLLYTIIVVTVLNVHEAKDVEKYKLRPHCSMTVHVWLCD